MQRRSTYAFAKIKPEKLPVCRDYIQTLISVIPRIRPRSRSVKRPLLQENRDLTKPRRRRQRERQKTIGLMSKTTTLHVYHAFLYISLPLLHNYDVK